MEGYRRNIYLSTYKSNEVEEKCEYVDLDTVKEIIDEIENQVNEILSKLEPIEGLNEIDEIKNMIDVLAKNLY